MKEETAHGGGVSAASYLMFSRGFCKELLSLGYRDGLRHADDIRNFFDLNGGDSARNGL